MRTATGDLHYGAGAARVGARHEPARAIKLEADVLVRTSASPRPTARASRTA